MPKALEDLRRDRAHAGATYRGAAQAYAAAWIELHAHDLALSNSNVIDRTTPPCAQFVPDGGVHLSVHPEFLPDVGPFMQHHLSAAAVKRQEQIMAALA